MSILIKGIEMPTNCFDCPCVEAEFMECAAKEHLSLPKDEYGAALGEVPNWCPLIPVPEHGDLIDRGYAIATACSGRIRVLPTTEDGEDWIRVEEVRESIKAAPTIIPASEEEHP